MKIQLACWSILLGLTCALSAQESKPVTATTGTEFSFTLASNPTTGYHWELASPLDQKLLTLVTNEYVRPNTRLVGAGGNEVWKFKAISEGKTQIDLKYVRPWEKDVKPVQATNFVVVISAAKPEK